MATHTVLRSLLFLFLVGITAYLVLPRIRGVVKTNLSYPRVMAAPHEAEEPQEEKAVLGMKQENMKYEMTSISAKVTESETPEDVSAKIDVNVTGFMKSKESANATAAVSSGAAELGRALGMKHGVGLPDIGSGGAPNHTQEVEL
ncbi:uncharacterized protein [Penaeus vannamei]|uniref:uncharacterized protein n=1 Tax=Penaeus vannamei TaxID=6689 RepID=UPI00387F4C29